MAIVGSASTFYCEDHFDRSVILFNSSFLNFIFLVGRVMYVLTSIYFVCLYTFVYIHKHPIVRLFLM